MGIAFKRLKKRILKEFPKKKLIGDIIIRDSEYEILLDYLKDKCKALIYSNVEIGNDPVFAVALVQVGIRYYDGNFWSHLTKLLGVKKITVEGQRRIGEAFYKVLYINNKDFLNKSDRVNNILLHGFVSDYYANAMFDFFFKYYNNDLERDLSRNNREMMNNLIEVIKKNDNTSRTYLLVKQTANAIKVNTRGGKIRIRRLLNLIDRAFWDGVTPENPTSRLSILFNQWLEISDEFNQQYNIYHSNSNKTKGKKAFSSPYFKCDFKNTSFKLVLPTQLIRLDFEEKEILWHIKYSDKVKEIKSHLQEAITGYKTKEVEIEVERENIFDEFIIELYCKEMRLKLFKIKADCIRFYDKDGDFLDLSNNLPKGEVYGFTRKNDIPISDALLDSEVIDNLIRSYFEFEIGDVVRLPDGRPISIGRKLKEGLLERKVLDGCYGKYNGSSIKIYKEPPRLFLKILPQRSVGTMIEINGVRYRLFDEKTIKIELGNAKGEQGYLINLGDYGCTNDGIYTVYVDVPNDRTNRLWQFLLINGINYQFEDAPYIFQSKGKIKFNEELNIKPANKNLEKNNDENSFNFIIEPELEYLPFTYKGQDYDIPIYFEIPCLKWKFPSGKWNVEKPDAIWHGDVPNIIYFKYPENKLKIFIDEHLDFSNQYQYLTFSKSKTKGYFECDITRFKSWLSREKDFRRIYIDFSQKPLEFLKIITCSVVESHILKWDYENEELVCELNIIGKANYCADLVLMDTKEKIVEKIPINQGKFVIKQSLNSGLYKIIIYEDEIDDTGFSSTFYYKIGEFEHKIINPNNLEGNKMLIKHIKRDEDISFKMELNCKYYISDLKQIDKNNYKGRLTVETKYGIKYLAEVKVQINDLDKLQFISLTFFDGQDYLEFLYDKKRQIIIKDEEKGLKSGESYRRYECLYPDEYLYMVEYIIERQNLASNKVTPIKEEKLVVEVEKTKEKDLLDTPICATGLSNFICNALKKSEITTIRDIVDGGKKRLAKVQGLNKKMLKEIEYQLYSLGIKID
ncbi:DNA-directed RNA polymerase subunit alpha C-terminal domain-containing protein [Anaerobranca gottschalkii]|uniref:RNA polymerase, alpha chain C terminal domain n=1 Tax=Anaerobranca gottschalkii DSM 13577 TaxID=1120990 RepID=A0A1H9YKT3_9FIRM|nr:DNA-directed RNA polymerase subunit alpha C-terminal domain-containing protein [Anaerobranca gottschalkii]SES69139.1 RNA polymerase, alpha chain C terminal domain [Anaerobranca gottschalkii DSM 13577]